jgi:hypothetical protein
MSLKALNKKGFAAVEALLIVIILAIIGGTGYYVYQANNKATNTQNNAHIDAESAVVHKTQYVTLKEWDVRAPYSGKLHLSYTVKSETAGVAFAAFTSSELAKQGGLCASSSNYGGTITRYPADAKMLDNAGEALDQTASAYAATLDKTDYARVGDYYFFYTSPQAPCSDKTDGQKVQTDTQSAVKALLPKLETAPKS